MKITLKDSKGASHEVEIKEGLTVPELKTLAKEKFVTAEGVTIKLIYHGKLLAEDKTIESYEIKEGSIVMVMQIKAASEQPQTDPDFEAHREVVQQVEALGYTREEALKSLKEADWDKVKAVNSLAQQDGEPGEALDLGPLLLGIDSLADSIENFFVNPDFKETRDKIREDPSKASGLLAEIPGISTEVKTAIQSNQAFVDQLVEELQMGSAFGDEEQEMIFEGELDNLPPQLQELLQQAAAQQAPPNPAEATGEEAEAPSLTEEDEQNIEYLKSLGSFSRDQCVEAYIACGKDTQLAANLLLDGN